MTPPALSSLLSRAGVALAVAGLFAVTLRSVPGLHPTTHRALDLVLLAIWAVYALHLALELVALRRDPAGPGRFALAVDVAAVALPLMAAALPSGTADAGFFCAVWALKPLRDLPAFRLMVTVVANEWHSMMGVLSLFALVFFLAATTAYLVEGPGQPEAFGSIPRAMWWAVTTLTTTGYGDVVPHTFAGRLLAGAVMMCGIGVFALWAGVLANGFSEEMRKRAFTEIWGLVSSVPLFADLPHRDLAQIVRVLKTRRAAPGAVLCRRGDIGTEMFFLLEGRVRVDSAPPVELGQGQYFGEMALISGAPRLATVTAVTPVMLLTLHASDFQLLIEQNAPLADSIHRTADERRGLRPGPAGGT